MCSDYEKIIFDENLELKTIGDLCEICGLHLQEVINKKTKFVIQIICPSCIDDDNSYLIDE